MNPEKTKRKISDITLLCVISLIVLLSACGDKHSLKKYTKYPSDLISRPSGTASIDESDAMEIINNINKRNSTEEDEEDFIKRAYSGLMVRRLTNVTPDEYSSYKQYLDDGAAYILIHPFFFPFFHYPQKLVDNTSKVFNKQNVVEKFLDMEPDNYEMLLLQAQERRMRDFVEFMSTQEKLLIIIVPKDYYRYTGYTYKRGWDEYMRFLNEVTNTSRSVLFAESRSPNRGYLTEEDAIKMMEFLLSVNAKTIYVGGGYIGRCLEDFYSLLTDEYGRKGIFVVPELSDLSPREINKAIAKALVRTNGTIDIDIATSMMKNDIYRIQEVLPELKNLQ